MVAKARPAVVLNLPFRDNERAVYAVVPHTTALRGGRFEVVIHDSLARPWRVRRSRISPHPWLGAHAPARRAERSTTGDDHSSHQSLVGNSLGLAGRTPIGRATIAVLHINDSAAVALRRLFINAGAFTLL
jgi:hypothetical protein